MYRSRRDHYRGPVPHQRTIVRDRVGHFGDGGVINEIDTFCGQRVCDATFHRATLRVVKRAPM